MRQLIPFIDLDQLVGGVGGDAEGAGHIQQHVLAGKGRLGHHVGRVDTLVDMHVDFSGHRQDALAHDGRQGQDVEHRCQHVSLPPYTTSASSARACGPGRPGVGEAGRGHR